MPNRSKTWSVWIALFFLWATWGYNFLVIKLTLPYIGPFQFALIRTWLSFAALALGLSYLGRFQLPKTNFGLITILGLLQTGGFTGFTYLALVSGGTGKIALLSFTNPLWASLFAFYILRERPHIQHWIAVSLAFIGILLFVQWTVGGSSLISSLYALGAGVSLGASSVVIKKLQQRGETDLIHITTWQLLIGSLPLLIGAVVFTEIPIVVNKILVFGIAYNIVSTAVGWPLWAYILKQMPAGVANMNTLVIPIIGLTAGWLHLEESFTKHEMMGMALIFLALVMIWSGSWFVKKLSNPHLA
ncbi:MAG: DMT family transporter [Nitrososphaera sp.]